MISAPFTDNFCAIKVLIRDSILLGQGMVTMKTDAVMGEEQRFAVKAGLVKFSRYNGKVAMLFQDSF